MVTLKGEVDVASVPLLQSHIEALTRTPTKHLVIDCAELEFIDSSGIHVLENVRQAVDGNLGLVRQRKAVRRLFEIVGLSREYPGFDTVAEAREYLHSGGMRRFSA